MAAALNRALADSLAADARVVVFGEDVGTLGGVFRVTDGLQKKHGDRRVFDAPIAEGGMLAVAVGMGAYGLRPIVEIQFADYIYPATDQLISAAARLRYRSGGEFWAPVTVREIPPLRTRPFRRARTADRLRRTIRPRGFRFGPGCSRCNTAHRAENGSARAVLDPAAAATLAATPP